MRAREHTPIGQHTIEGNRNEWDVCEFDAETVKCGFQFVFHGSR